MVVRRLPHPTGGNHLAIFPLPLLQIEQPELRHVTGSEHQSAAGVRVPFVVAVPPGALDPQRPEEMLVEVGIGVLPGARLENAGEQNHAAAVVLEARPRFVGHRAAEVELGPPFPQLVQLAVRRGLVGSPLEVVGSGAHRQEILEHHLLLPVVDVLDPLEILEEAEHRFVDPLDLPPLDRDPDRRGGEALGDRLQGVQSVAALVVEVLLEDEMPATHHEQAVDVGVLLPGVDQRGQLPQGFLVQALLRRRTCRPLLGRPGDLALVVVGGSEKGKRRREAEHRAQSGNRDLVHGRGGGSDCGRAAKAGRGEARSTPQPTQLYSPPPLRSVVIVYRSVRRGSGVD